MMNNATTTMKVAEVTDDVAMTTTLPFILGSEVASEVSGSEVASEVLGPEVVSEIKMDLNQ